MIQEDQTSCPKFVQAIQSKEETEIQESPLFADGLKTMIIVFPMRKNFPEMIHLILPLLYLMLQMREPRKVQ